MSREYLRSLFEETYKQTGLPDDIQHLLVEYGVTFDEDFPLLAPYGDLKETLEKCLKENKPYDPPYEDGIIY